MLNDNSTSADCQDAYEQGESDDTQLYNIRPYDANYNIFRVKCLFDGYNGWTVFSNRSDGSLDSARIIFGPGGHIDSDFWAGIV